MTKDWETYGSILLELYLGEEQNLEDALAPLSKDGAVTASPSAYGNRLKQLEILSCGSSSPSDNKNAFRARIVPNEHGGQSVKTPQDSFKTTVSEIVCRLRSSIRGIVTNASTAQSPLRMAVGDMNHSSIEAVQTRLEQNAEAWIKLIEGMQENSIAEASQHTEWKNIIASILGQPFAVCASTDLDKKNRHFDSEIYSCSDLQCQFLPSSKDASQARPEAASHRGFDLDEKQPLPSELAGRMDQTYTSGIPSVSSISLSLTDTITCTASSYQDEVDDSDACGYLATGDDLDGLQGRLFGVDFQQSVFTSLPDKISPIQEQEGKSPSHPEMAYTSIDLENSSPFPEVDRLNMTEVWRPGPTRNALGGDIHAEVVSLSSRRSEPMLASSRSSDCPASSNATDSADGEASVMCYEWQWLTADTDLSPRPSVPPSLAVLETQMVEHLRQSYQAQSEKQNSTPPPVPSSTSSSSSMSDDRKSSSSRKTSRRDIETPSDVYDHGPSVKKGRKLIPPGEIRLACHFQKRNPERYPACGIRKNGFRTVAEIKQHFWRNHQQNPNYCPRCKASFDTAQLKDDHVRQAFVTPCPESAANIPEGLSHELCTVLKRRVDKECDLFEQWFSIWDIIFPEIPRPDNPMFDLCDDVHIQTLDLAAFLETEGPGVVTSMLREEGYLVSLTSTEVDASISRVVNTAFKRVFEAWKTRRGRLSRSSANPFDILSDPVQSIGEPGTQLASPGVVLCQAADHKETNISPDFAIDFDNTNDMPWYAGTWDEGNDGFQFRSY